MGGRYPHPGVSRTSIRDAHPTPRVFWKKRLDLVDCKGVEFFGGVKETAKRLQTAEKMGFATEEGS